MKFILITAIFLSIYVKAEDAPPAPLCPSLEGEYVTSACPTEGTAFVTMRIMQPNCTAIGYGYINYSKDGVPTQNGNTTWDVIGAGKMQLQDNARTTTYMERTYTNNSLLRYTYTLDKITNKTSITAAAINILSNNNLLSSYFSNGNATYVNVKNCASTKSFFNNSKL